MRAGFGKASITPPLGTYMMGFGRRDDAHGCDAVHDEIFVRALYVEHTGEKALIMGLFPDCEVENVLSVGNAAGDGARIALLDRDMRTEANWLSGNVEYIELTVEKDFEQQFMESMQIPHMTDLFPHLEGLVPEDVLHQK